MSRLPSLRILRNRRRQRGPRSYLFYTGIARNKKSSLSLEGEEQTLEMTK